MSHFNPGGPRVNFFIAMKRIRLEVIFKLIQIKIIVRIQIIVNALRQLGEKVKLEPLDANYNL